jgi:Protein of unknown function (DUF2442)
MGILALAADERVAALRCTDDSLSVDLMDGPLRSLWSGTPRLANASNAQRENWQICGGDYGIHWPEVDEDLSTEGLLRGAPSPEYRRAQSAKMAKKKASRSVQRLGKKR